MKKQTKIVRVCRRCGTRVKKTTTPGYKFYCPEHDEDLYGFETEVVRKTRRLSHGLRPV